MKKEFFLAVFYFLCPIVLSEDLLRNPLFQYRYQTEDVMKPAASNVPLRGYHVVEGGYFPSESDNSFGDIRNGGGLMESPTSYSGQFIHPHQLVPIAAAGQLGPQLLGPIIPKYTTAGLVGVGPAGIGFGHPGLGLAGAGAIGLGGFGGYQHYPHHVGGEQVAKEAFAGGKKNIADEKFEKSSGKKGEEVSHDKSGYSKGEASAKDIKGDAGYYSNADGVKKAEEDKKEYHGGQHFNKEGKSGEEQTVNKGHKKGHKVKSFKTSHHKDESGKTEEYYDEEHDEGGNFAFKGNKDSYGEKGESAFKGGKEEGKFNAAEAKKEGHFKNEHSVDKAEGDQGKYGENKFAGNEALFGYKNGADEQSLLGHQETSKFYKSHPFVIPFYQR